MATIDTSKLYVGGLPWLLDSEGLRELFLDFGTVLEAMVIYDGRSGKSKGFGFVTFATRSEAEKALERHGHKIGKAKLRVAFAKEQ